MDTKYLSELPDSIFRLLKSSVIEDVIIGVELCYTKMGKAWCEDHFCAEYEPRFKTTDPDPLIWVLFDDLDICIGHYFIESFHNREIALDRTDIRIVNNKTK